MIINTLYLILTVVFWLYFGCILVVFWLYFLEVVKSCKKYNRKNELMC
jgi:hypothetical protein